MNDLELRIYGMVAQAIAQHAFTRAEAEDEENRQVHPDAPWPIYYHLAMSTFEAVADDLERLRIFRALGKEKTFFVFDCEVSEANVVAERNAHFGPPFIELLVTFINLFADFGPDYWGFSARPNVAFGLNSRILPTLDALALAGYLSKTEEGYVWTKLIAPAMLASYFDQEWIDPHQQ